MARRRGSRNKRRREARPAERRDLYLPVGVAFEATRPRRPPYRRYEKRDARRLFRVFEYARRIAAGKAKAPRRDTVLRRPWRYTRCGRRWLRRRMIIATGFGGRNGVRRYKSRDVQPCQ